MRMPMTDTINTVVVFNRFGEIVGAINNTHIKQGQPVKFTYESCRCGESIIPGSLRLSEVKND